MKKLLSIILLSCVCLTWGTKAQALIINPDPTTFAADDGTQYFTPAAGLIGIEVLDLFGGLGAGSTFGFYFKSAPSAPIVIFDSLDQTVTQVAGIDFTSGIVLDVDSSSVQSTFSGSGPIGFFLGINPLIPGGGFGITTDPLLNPAGLDLAATFPLISSPSGYLLGFELPIRGRFVTIGLDLVSGIQPYRKVPEAPALMLMLSAILLWGLHRRRNAA